MLTLIKKAEVIKLIEDKVDFHVSKMCVCSVMSNCLQL